METTNLSSIDGIKAIKPINSNTVHKICSGQVVLSLAIAVKELIENSLDAGATSVDVRLKNYGVDLIEVSDNGSGVVEDNFAALTLKYHTSKLNDYSDLLGVSSFGFRGEALSSLCALSDLVITTRHNSSEHATRIEYDQKGHIRKKTPCSRQVGTTVTLSNLFSSLPVRQKEFHKNAKREFNRLTQLLYGYCLISLGVKITCSNQTNTNSKSLVVATQGSDSYKDNITCVFGPKQLQSLLEVKPEYVPNIKNNILKGLANSDKTNQETIEIEDIEIDLSEDSNDADKESSLCNSQSSSKSQGYKNNILPLDISGFVSSCAHGSGRSSTDRQFYFVNSRPCEPVKVMKLVNEIYKQFNPNQYPFVFLNINLDQSSVDVNVTPDKRKVFLTKEKIVLDIVKSSLLKLYEDIPRILKVESLEKSHKKESLPEVKPEIDQPRIFNSFIQRFASKSGQPDNDFNKIVTKGPDLKRKSTTMLDFVSSKSIKVDSSDKSYDISTTNANIGHKIEECGDFVNETVNELTSKIMDIESDDGTVLSEEDTNESLVSESNCSDLNTKSLEEHPEKEMMYLESTDNLPTTQIRQVDEVVVEKAHTIYCKTIKKVKEKIAESPKKIVTDQSDHGKFKHKSVVLKTSLDHIKALTQANNEYKKKNFAPEVVRFKSTINPVFNKKCEEELSKEISKDSFKKMNIIGQFNLGFIITCLDDDLFIIDQHATDEIYNFETLQKTTELTSQKLVIPQQLELTGVNEQILMDNIDVFKKNGFTFAINEDALPTKRVKLLTIPMSKNWIFGKEDIEELLFMLRESPSEYCRPSRVRAMFASRACRKSVMIGTALSKADMKILVEHMADIDQPWNCPHGRPTIRHLVNLAMVKTT